MVELDNFKSQLQSYKAPLQEVRDSLLLSWQRTADSGIGTGDGGTGFLERSGSFPEQDEGSQKFKGRCGNLCGIVDAI